MEENRTDYEPNFVMKDAEPQASSAWQNHSSESPIAENTSYVKADTFFGEERPEPTPQPTTPTEEDGLYVDPREKFRNREKTAAAGASAKWGGGRARAESGSSGSGFTGAGFSGLNNLLSGFCLGQCCWHAFTTGSFAIYHVIFLGHNEQSANLVTLSVGIEIA